MADHEFPPEIIFKILSILPIKSLARFRCVCKSWLEYIDDPYLEIIHDVKEEPTPMSFQQHPVDIYSRPPKLNAPCEISFLHVIFQNTTTTVTKKLVLELSYNGSNSSMRNSFSEWLVGSCNGLTLVCYAQEKFDGIVLALVNPLTKQYHDLPLIKFRTDEKITWPLFDRSHGAGVGFDDSTNTFKTVCVILNGVIFSEDNNVFRRHLYTVVHCSGMNSWQQIPQIPDYPITGAGVLAHGRLYWLVSNRWRFVHQGRKVVWFDVKMEKFGLINPPIKKEHHKYNDMLTQLVDLNGELGYSYNGDDKFIELWKLKEEEWVFHLRINNAMSY